MKLGLAVEKAWNRFYSKTIVPRLEKTYTAEDGEVIHYLFYPKKNSKILIVILQAFHPAGARYNYIATLSDVKANRLYIKDDYDPASGNFHLGHKGTFSQEADVHAFIRQIAEKCHAEKLIFVGSCKGGFCALNFGIEFPGSSMIVGAPIYLVGSKMMELKKWHRALADVIGAEPTPEGIRALDDRLRDKIRNDPYKQTHRFYVHYSVNDHYYDDGVIYLLEDLENIHATLDRNQADYQGHDNLKWFFPDYLKKSIAKEINAVSE